MSGDPQPGDLGRLEQLAVALRHHVGAGAREPPSFPLELITRDSDGGLRSTCFTRAELAQCVALGLVHFPGFLPFASSGPAGEAKVATAIPPAVATTETLTEAELRALGLRLRDVHYELAGAATEEPQKAERLAAAADRPWNKYTMGAITQLVRLQVLIRTADGYRRGYRRLPGAAAA